MCQRCSVSECQRLIRQFLFSAFKISDFKMSACQNVSVSVFGFKFLFSIFEISDLSCVVRSLVVNPAFSVSASGFNQSTLNCN
jgi:hypothetical protein